MPMRDDFCVFILSHGRAGNVITYKTLRKGGYTGKVYVVIDDEDKMGEDYRREFGDEVLTFSKREVAKVVDAGDNSGEMRSVLYARHACFALAEEVGCRYFLQLDDDYTTFQYRYLPGVRFGYAPVRSTMDRWITAVLDFYVGTSALSVAVAQGGDYIGGDPGDIVGKRKCMNSFFCSVDRPFRFAGIMNEDVSTYVTEGRRGGLFLTLMPVQLQQPASQSSPGGVTELYLDSGTYRKAFYTVLHAPSCTRIGVLVDHSSPHPRLHHAIDSRFAYPKILREDARKES